MAQLPTTPAEAEAETDAQTDEEIANAAMQRVRDTPTHPVCECGERALARVTVDAMGEQQHRFTCLECTIRAVRVAAAQHQLLDVTVHTPLDVGARD